MAPAAADQVVADVGVGGVGGLSGHLPCPFDALEREPQLSVACRFGQLLNGVPITIAASEVHPAVHAGRVALENLFDEADALEELAPVERRDEA